MNQVYLHDKGMTLKRINKYKARKAYYNGLDVLFIPCRMNPLNRAFNLGIWENKNLDGQYSDFTALYNAYSYYNCNNETGKYIAFYIPVVTVDRFTGEAPTSKTMGTIEQYDYSFMKGRE